MATITGYGGVGEIGGNAFLIDDEKTRILLDFGKRFGTDDPVEDPAIRPGWSDYWDEYLNPRTFRFIPDLLTVGLLPPIDGLYRRDLGGPEGRAVDGILVTHAHMDHAGLLGLARHNIPIHMSSDSRATLESIQATGQSKAENDLVTAQHRGHVGYLKSGELTNRADFDPGPARNIQTAHAATIGDWNVEYHPVDHSIHGAYAAILTGGGPSIAYTGDYRLHGRSGHLSEKFVERAQGVDYLITEGTRIKRPSDREKTVPASDKETEVEDEIAGYVEKEDARNARTGFVAISYPPRDLDRFQSVYNAARRVGRRLTIPTKLADLLDRMRAAGHAELPDPKNDATIGVHVRPKEKGTILHYPNGPVPAMRADGTIQHEAPDAAAFKRLLLRDYDKWEHPYADSRNAVTSAQIYQDPSAFLVSMNYWGITDLFDCFPQPVQANGLYIHSATQPFNDDMEQNDRKLARWLKLFGLDRANTHVSGHLNPDDLDWVLDKIKPKVLIPVHTQADAYTAQRYESRVKRKAIIPVYAQPIPL